MQLVLLLVGNGPDACRMNLLRGKRVRLVCGTTSMYTGLDGLTAIIRCHLRCDPCDGSIYVFCDAMGSKLKYIEWDGQSFR